MLPRYKWGLLAGVVVALLNLCGDALFSPLSDCLSVVTVAAAAILAGFLCARQEPPDQATKAGAVAGTIIGLFNLASQVVGGVLAGLVGLGIVTALKPQVQADPALYSRGVAAGLGVMLGLVLLVGVALLFLGAGLGALAARLARPKTDAAEEAWPERF